MTRLTDKEREAVERGLSMKDWTGFDNQDQRDLLTLASCVTRLDADLSAAEAKIAGMAARIAELEEQAKKMVFAEPCEYCAAMLLDCSHARAIIETSGGEA